MTTTFLWLCEKRVNITLEAQWAEPVSHTSRTNQKQELPMGAMFVNGLGQNEQSL
jgi:hypothetical protein